LVADGAAAEDVEAGPEVVGAPIVVLRVRLELRPPAVLVTTEVPEEEVTFEAAVMVVCALLVVLELALTVDEVIFLVTGLPVEEAVALAVLLALVEEEEPAEIWKGSEYWKVLGSESSEILIP